MYHEFVTFAREVCSWKALATGRYPHVSTYWWRVCWHQNWSGCCAEEESSVVLPTIETRFTGHSTTMRRITTFRSTTDRMYDGGKDFWKLWISWFSRKITCQSKSSVWMKPPYSGNGCLEGLSSMRRPSQYVVSVFV